MALPLPLTSRSVGRASRTRASPCVHTEGSYLDLTLVVVTSTSRRYTKMPLSSASTTSRTWQVSSPPPPTYALSYIAVPPPLHPPPVRVPIYTDRCNNKHTSRNRKHASRRLDERLG